MKIELILELVSILLNTQTEYKHLESFFFLLQTWLLKLKR